MPYKLNVRIPKVDGTSADELHKYLYTYLKSQINAAHLKEIDLCVSTVEGNVSTISSSKFVSESTYDNNVGVWISLPLKREFQVCISGDIKALDDIDAKLINTYVMGTVNEYFNVSSVRFSVSEEVIFPEGFREDFGTEERSQRELPNRFSQRERFSQQCVKSKL